MKIEFQYLRDSHNGDKTKRLKENLLNCLIRPHKFIVQCSLVFNQLRKEIRQSILHKNIIRHNNYNSICRVLKAGVLLLLIKQMVQTRELEAFIEN